MVSNHAGGRAVYTQSQLIKAHLIPRTIRLQIRVERDTFNMQRGGNISFFAGMWDVESELKSKQLRGQEELFQPHH